MGTFEAVKELRKNRIGFKQENGSEKSESELSVEEMLQLFHNATNPKLTKSETKKNLALA